MQYYRYYATVKKNVKPGTVFIKTETDKDTDSRDFSRDIYLKAEDFNEALNSEAYYFVEDFDNKDYVSIGAIVKDSKDVLKTIKRFSESIGIKLPPDGELTEVTFGRISRMINSGSRSGYTIHRDYILDMFDIGSLRGSYFESYNEAIFSECDKDRIYKGASRLLSSRLLTEELDRIYIPKKNRSVSGFPVHYLICTDDFDEKMEAINALLPALYANNRICSKRHSHIEIRNSKSVLEYLDALFKSSFGGTVIVDYESSDEDESDVTSFVVDVIEGACELMCRYGDRVQIMLCLPRECSKVKDLFFANLEALRFIEINESLASGETAKEYLRRLASDAKIRPDKKLYAKLVEDKGYIATELKKMFNEWYTDKMRTSVYPQYKDVATAKNIQRTKAPEGNAYNKLNDMIGLADAKKVINQALDYYKAQKLFSKKGVVTDRPAMHMVFTGNPGTAKTTTARLFARIMKDNGLLSKGHLIEVGRGDLVGKYVGWTAPTVQKKFKEAEGGVLFIDEAYSLVDDRNGSYGDEAINTIVQEMENHREDMVVIFAGYPDKMDEFINKNPGLRSRIAFYVPFEDYDTDSLCQIASMIAKQKGLSFSDPALEKLAAIFDRVKSQEDFGNGRYARNIVEKARMAQASRIVKMDYESVTDKDLMTLCPEDIEMPTEVKQIKRFGFCA
jgi:AAA+ superfamily predicted ATPase